MNCREAQERILESFERPLAGEEKTQLDGHFSRCVDCTRFAAEQSRLDLRLREVFAPPRLGPGFRRGLRARISREQREHWPDWLPDLAYLAGSVPAVALCAILLPLPVSAVLEMGALVAFLAYLLQSLLVSALEPKTD